MFTFHKTNASPGSKQSTADSLVTDPSTSTSDVYMSHSSEASYGELSSSNQEPRAHIGKRSSVFGLRSRSNTATSATSIHSVTSPGIAGYDPMAHRATQHMSGQSFMDLQSGKRSLFRGKRGRRTSGAFSNFEFDEQDELEASNKRNSILRKNRRQINQSESSIHPLRHRISKPFDFQHLTHTERNQFAALGQASENDLEAEFHAVRASQAPRRDLAGIKAEDLHFNNFSSENLAMPDSRAPSSLAMRSPLMSTAPELQRTISAERTLRLTRSVESFSQPGINSRAHRHTQSGNPLPRTSSRMALSPIHDISEESCPSDPPQQYSPRSNRQSGVWDMFAPLSPKSTPGHLPTTTEESDYFAHAVTTPDDSAIPATPPFSPGLDDVEEEPESFVSPRPAPCPPARGARSPTSPAFESFSFNNRRSPISKSYNRGSFYSSPKSPGARGAMTRPISQMSDTLGSPSHNRRGSLRKTPSVRRKSNTWRVIEESWEDDIDYIYDNALEADCDFDWDRTSDDEGWEDRDRTPEQQDHFRPSAATAPIKQSDYEDSLQTRFFPGAFRPSLLVPSATNVPELEARSAVSTSTADTGVRTPSDFFSPTGPTCGPSEEDDDFNLNPSLLVPQDFKDHVSREDMYDDLLADYDGSDRHFPLLDGSQSIASSIRSSNIRSSKRSSCDSSLISSGQASGQWSAGVRRSASSSGSLPELVHSRRARQDFNTMVDRLTEQVASFSSFGESMEDVEDDDTTPPGRGPEQRTFFAPESEQQPSEAVRASIETEVRASLELARRGSVRSSRNPPNHKYASSDGAAKLLASPLQPSPQLQSTKASRNRAASSSSATRKSRGPYLSLFPTPPTRSPLGTPSGSASRRF